MRCKAQHNSCAHSKVEREDSFITGKPLLTYPITLVTVSTVTVTIKVTTLVYVLSVHALSRTAHTRVSVLGDGGPDHTSCTLPLAITLIIIGSASYGSLP